MGVPATLIQIQLRPQVLQCAARDAARTEVALNRARTIHSTAATTVVMRLALLQTVLVGAARAQIPCATLTSVARNAPQHPVAQPMGRLTTTRLR